MKECDRAQVHRFREYVAVWLGNGETLYLTEKDASALAAALADCAQDIRARPSFSQSQFNTWSMTGNHNGTH